LPGWAEKTGPWASFLTNYLVISHFRVYIGSEKEKRKSTIREHGLAGEKNIGFFLVGNPCGSSFPSSSSRMIPGLIGVIFTKFKRPSDPDSV